MPITLEGTKNAAPCIVLSTAKTASGTAVDFVGIPEGVKRITVMFNGVSTNGASNYLTQLGGAGGIENTGYLGTGFGVGGTSIGVSAPVTAGFLFSVTNAGSNVNGSATINIFGGNTWVFNGAIASSTDARAWVGAGSKTLSGTLDRLRITTVNGTDQFDAGTINISWEF